MPLDSAFFSSPRRALSGARRSAARGRIRSRLIGSRRPRSTRGNATAFWVAAVAAGITFSTMANGQKLSLRDYVGPSGNLVAMAAAGAPRAPERRVEIRRPVTPPMQDQSNLPPEKRVGCR